MFLPTTREELRRLGWDCLDVILVTGDAYIDSPFIGVAVIGKVLSAAGYRVGIISQPDVDTDKDILRLGEPRLLWGITGGSIDSMVANRTAAGKRRRQDDYTPGGINTRRPDRAVLVYANLIRRYFKNTCPLVLGGIEASLRRIAHYDYWSNRVRRSILFDAKADYLLYGMADQTVVELAGALKKGGDPRFIRGLCYIAAEPPADARKLPSFREAAADRAAFTRLFDLFYRNNDPIRGEILVQEHDGRWLVQNPPPLPLSEAELDRVHELEYALEVHPFYAGQGQVRALETIRFSLTTHRGCYGECSFCAIAVHQGRTVSGRSPESLIREARRLAAHPRFKGTIHDVGGPTANMYGFECARKLKKGSCPDKRCLHPDVCPSLKVDHSKQVKLLEALRQVQGIRKVVVASGIRYDMILADRKQGLAYLRQLVRHYVSGQLKIAPEHSEKRVLALMGKPGTDSLLQFRELFLQITAEEGLDQYLTYYMIAAHPGCTLQDMQRLRRFCTERLNLLPRQVQVFTPTPSTWSTLMYCTEKDPFSGSSCMVEKTSAGRERQKQALAGGRGPAKKSFRKAAGEKKKRQR